jgi:hypothetical protein
VLLEQLEQPAAEKEREAAGKKKEEENNKFCSGQCAVARASGRGAKRGCFFLFGEGGAEEEISPSAESSGSYHGLPLVSSHQSS